MDNAFLNNVEYNPLMVNISDRKKKLKFPIPVDSGQHISFHLIYENKTRLQEFYQIQYENSLELYPSLQYGSPLSSTGQTKGILSCHSLKLHLLLPDRGHLNFRYKWCSRSQQH